MSKHDLKANIVKVNEIMSRDRVEIVARNVLSYMAEHELDDLDLVYWKKVVDLFNELGAGITFVGEFDDFEELNDVPIEDIPDGGYAFVGTDPNFDVYFWDSTAEEWTSFSFPVVLPDGIVTIGGIVEDGSDLEYDTAWKWRINSVEYQPVSVTSLNFPAASAGNHRRDLVVGNESGQIVRIAGTEVALENPALAPSVPANTVGLSEVYVLETGIDDFVNFALSSFVRFDINNQNLSPVQRQNARTNTQSLAKDVADTKLAQLDIRSIINTPAALFRLLKEDGGVILNVTGSNSNNLTTLNGLFQINGGAGSGFTFGVRSHATSDSLGTKRFRFQNSLGNDQVVIGSVDVRDNAIHDFFGRILQSVRSNAFNHLTRRDELRLNYSQSLGTGGQIDNLELANAGVKMLILTAATDLTGIVGEAGQLLRVISRVAGSAIFHQNTGSDAANRFDLVADIGLIQNRPYDLIYDNSRWRLKGMEETTEGLILNTGQIKFLPTQNPSSDPNTLDDYETGTWTPQLFLGTTANPSNMVFGRYTRIGNIVHIQFSFIPGDNGSPTGTGDAVIHGLPFVSSSFSNQNQEFWISTRRLSYPSTGPIFGRFIGGQARFSLRCITSSSTQSDDVAVTNANFSATNPFVKGNFSYRV